MDWATILRLIELTPLDHERDDAEPMGGAEGEYESVGFIPQYLQ